MSARIGMCLLLTVATLLGGWATLPACACAPVPKQSVPNCCCTKAMIASGSKCACCQTAGPQPVSAGDARCACNTAPADQSPPATPAPTAAEQPAGLSDGGLDFARPLAASPALISFGRPPGALTDLVISLSHLTC